IIRRGIYMKKDLKVKLSIYNDERIVIENYRQLIDLNEDIIKVDIYTIVGQFLKLKRMDSYMIEVVGTVGQIIIAD
ncbi:MAG: YabP/YqfC family sporulation protein, partial [Bacilli bacterium]|nr:YabP/YqfC family sporulation protein [Bacilli bacterium]